MFLKKLNFFVVFIFMMVIGCGITNVKVNAFGANKTDNIQIELLSYKTNSKLELKYKVWQTFKEESHGIFLSLPKNQDGVWTDYNLISVKRTPEVVDLDLSDDLPKISSNSLVDEKFENFIEWDQFRLRIGDKNKTLRGQYYYEIVLEANYNQNEQYNFTLLHDWTDPVGDIQVFQDEKNICKIEISCESDLTQYVLNPDLPEQNFKNNLTFCVFTLFPYILITVIGAIFIYGFWLKFAKDSFNIEKANSPEFEPPHDVLPWEAEFLASDAKISVKNTLLSYILWLNNQKIVEFIPDGSPKNLPQSKMQIILKNDLPRGLLPEVFNLAVTLSANKDLKSGIYQSKINESQDSSKLYKHILKGVSQNYSQMPLDEGVKYAIILVVGFALIFGIIFGFQVLQDAVLLGNSYLGLVILIGVFIEILVVVLVLFWSKPTEKGAEQINKIKRYKYYLEYVEKYKLDFSNNPDEGVQYYLKSVSFAAAFGLLDRFQKYFKTLLPENSELENTQLLYSSYTHVIFYTPPSESSSSGSSFGGGGSSGGGGSW